MKHYNKPFNVPKNYFEHLNKAVKSSIQTRENCTVIQIKSTRLIRTITSIAASFVIITVCCFLIKNQNQQIVGDIKTIKRHIKKYEPISYTEIADYIMLDNDDLYGYMYDTQ